MSRKYVAAPGAMFKPKQAQAIGEELEKLGEAITPDAVVLAASSPESILHSCFEWKDDEAARRFRLHQARQLLNHVMVVVAMPNGKQSPMRAFHSIVVSGVSADGAEKKQRAYIHIKLAETNPAAAAQVIEQAKAELQAWARRYRDYKDYLPVVFEALEAVA